MSTVEQLVQAAPAARAVLSSDVIAAVCLKYKAADETFSTTWSRAQRATYTSILNFEDSLLAPVHRWFRYKEGFSPRYVQSVLDRFPAEPGSAILDPFCGVGTTLVEAQGRGFQAEGFEVNPFAAFIANLKTREWPENIDIEFERCILALSRARPDSPAPLPDNSTVVSYYDSDVLERLLCWKQWGRDHVANPVHDAFKLGWLLAAEGLCNAHKAGNGLKRKKGASSRALLPQLADERIRETIIGLLADMRTDISGCRRRPTATIFEESSLMLHRLGKRPIGACITSPPYANCFDYTKIYLCELWLGDFISSVNDQRDVRLKSLRSHVHFSWPERGRRPPLDLLTEVILPALRSISLWSNKIPSMLEGYFSDLFALLQQMHKSMLPRAVAAFAVSNPVYAGCPIAVDLFLCELARAAGFEVVGVEVDRAIIPSSQQFTRLGRSADYVRESSVLIRNR